MKRTATFEACVSGPAHAGPPLRQPAANEQQASLPSLKLAGIAVYIDASQRSAAEVTRTRGRTTPTFVPSDVNVAIRTRNFGRGGLRACGRKKQEWVAPTLARPISIAMRGNGPLMAEGIWLIRPIVSSQTA